MNEKLENKYKRLFALLDRWMVQEYKGNDIEKYFIKYNYQRIAVYGMGRCGKWLIRLLKNSDIKIAYILDKRTGIDTLGMIQKKLDDTLPEVDAIVVTAIDEFDDIEQMLCSKVDTTVIALDEIIDELEQM